MSVGRLALDQLNISVDNYFASEVDKFAIKVSQANFPDIIQLGDIKEISGQQLPKIDLLIGGSPCQDLSFANPDGEGLEGARSNLFFEYVRLLRETKPKYFILENVRMKKENLERMTESINLADPGSKIIEPILINSSLVSGQNRLRYYWTNIPGVAQPKDRNISLMDILETGNMDYIQADVLAKNGKKITRQNINKSICLSARDWKGWSGHGSVGIRVKSGALRGRSIDSSGKHLAWKSVKPIQVLETRKDQKSYTVSTVEKDNLVVIDDMYYRKLTCLEMERLQTVPDYFTDYVSMTQRKKMLGNSFTNEVIKHILKGITF